MNTMNFINTVKEFLAQDFGNIILSIFILMAFCIAVYEIIGKFSKIIKKPVKWVSKKDEDHELLMQTIQDLTALHNKHEEDTKQSIRHDEMIRDDIKELTSTIREVVVRLSDMEAKIDATEMAKLKDKILGYYRKYKDLGEWERFEADTFWGLYDRYITHGGNSFVKHDIEPVMRNLQIKD